MWEFLVVIKNLLLASGIFASFQTRSEHNRMRHHLVHKYRIGDTDQWHALATQDWWQRAMYSKTDHCVKPSGRTSGQWCQPTGPTVRSHVLQDFPLHEALRKDIWPMVSTYRTNCTEPCTPRLPTAWSPQEGHLANGVNLQDQLYCTEPCTTRLTTAWSPQEGRLANGVNLQDQLYGAMYSKTAHCVKPSGRTSGQWCQPTGPTVRRQSRYAAGQRSTSDERDDCLEKCECEEDSPRNGNFPWCTWTHNDNNNDMWGGKRGRGALFWFRGGEGPYP
jgi:hypothetical protein